jgi:CBS domain-containing protein
MNIGDLCNKDLVVAYLDDTLYEAAKLMRQRHVGSLIVVSKDEKGLRPIGIITDRDIIIEVVAEEINLKAITLKDIMTTHPIVARENDGIHETLQSMREKGVRRIPVVDLQGYLIGIITTDDILKILADKLGNLTSFIQQEQNAGDVSR